jgi:hypothetical protein
MKGQIALEFLLAFLAMIGIAYVLVQGQQGVSGELDNRIIRTGLGMKTEQIASYCNLIYFNWDNVVGNFSVDVEGFNFHGNEIVLKEDGPEVRSRCLSPEISGVGELKVSGVKRWF